MGSRAFRTPVRAGKPRGPTLVSIFMHALIVARVSHVRDKAAAPAMTFPINSRGGGVCACEASAGGRASRFGKAVYPRENRATPRRGRAIGYRNSTTGRPHLRPGRAVDTRSPHTEPRGSVGILPPAYLAACASASPRGRRARGKVSRQPTASAAPRERVFRCVSRDTPPTSHKGKSRPFKTIQKNRLSGGKSAPFPTLTPQTQKHPVQRHGPHTLRIKTALFCGKLGVWGPRDTLA